MITKETKVVQIFELEKSIYLMKLYAPEVAANCYPGQFVNIKVTNSTFPLLRRPFSICDVEGENVIFMFSVYGEGTKLLASKKTGEDIDLLGPLGRGFNIDDDYDAAFFVAGGIGVAPFPFLTRMLPEDKKVYSFIGGRSVHDVITYGMKNYLISTDDGTLGFKGNVVELLENNIELFKNHKVKIFGCGPTAMLRALKAFSLKYDFNCEVSTESAMACGFGICQGCPIETPEREEYYLICKDGPVFNVKSVIL